MSADQPRETPEQLLARIGKDYGVGSSVQPEVKPAPPPAPAPKVQPAGLFQRARDALSGRKDQIDRAAGYANGGEIGGGTRRRGAAYDDAVIGEGTAGAKKAITSRQRISPVSSLLYNGMSTPLFDTTAFDAYSSGGYDPYIVDSGGGGVGGSPGSSQGGISPGVAEGAARAALGLGFSAFGPLGSLVDNAPRAFGQAPISAQLAAEMTYPGYDFPDLPSLDMDLPGLDATVASQAAVAEAYGGKDGLSAAMDNLGPLGDAPAAGTWGGPDNSGSSSSTDSDPGPDGTSGGGTNGGGEDDAGDGNGWANGGLITPRAGIGAPQQQNSQMDSARINDMLQRNPQVQQRVTAALQQAVAQGRVDPVQLHQGLQMAQACMNNPALWPQLRQHAIRTGMVQPNQLPEQYDRGLVVMLVAVLRSVEASGGVQALGQKQQQPVQPQQFANGGVIVGPGTGTSDSVHTQNTSTGEPVKVSNGEYVVPADVVRAKGVDFFDGLVKKYHQPTGYQK